MRNQNCLGKEEVVMKRRRDGEGKTRNEVLDWNEVNLDFEFVEFRERVEIQNKKEFQEKRKQQGLLSDTDLRVGMESTNLWNHFSIKISYSK